MGLTLLRRSTWFKVSLLGILVLAACTNAPINVAPRIDSFVADPTTVQAGGSSQLSWQVTGADSIAISTEAGEVTTSTEASGSFAVTPTETTTYTLTATNETGSNTAEVTVTVGSVEGEPTINSFTAAPATIVAGGSSTLSWDVTGADSVVISNSDGEVHTSPESTGSFEVSPATTTTYTLTATNATGNATSQATVTVADPSDTAISNLTATVVRGSQVELSWMASAANSFEVYAVANGNPDDAELVSTPSSSPTTIDIPASGRQTVRVVAVGTGASASAEVVLTNVVTSAGDYDVYTSLGFEPEATVTGSLRDIVNRAPAGTVIGFASDITEVQLYGVELDRPVMGQPLVDAHIFLRKDVTISGPAGGVTLRGVDSPRIDMGQPIEWRSRIVFVWPDTTVLLENLTITGGDFIFAGAGIRNAGDLTLENVNVVGNRAWHQGGGIFNAAEANLALVDSLVADNVSAVFLEEVGHTYMIRGRDGVTINDGGYGGGIYNLGSMTIEGSEVSTNSVKFGGGGIYNGVGSDGSITGTLISQNVANAVTYGGNETNWGGGVLTEGLLDVTATEFVSNSARYNGGGITVSENSTTTLSGSTTFSTNTAEFGGAIYHRYSGTPSNLDFASVNDNGTNVATGGTGFYFGVDVALTPVTARDAQGFYVEPVNPGPNYRR